MLLWHNWLSKQSLTGLQRHTPEPSSPTATIRIFLCPPHSNVLPEEEQARDRLIDKIRDSLEGSGVEIEMPNFRKTNREDHGPAIYLDRVARLRNTDLVILLLDPPATGVGVMLQLFHNATIPCLCVTKNWSAVSRMVRGLALSQLSYIEYSFLDAVGPAIAKWFRENADAIRQSQSHRDRAWQRLRGLDIRRTMILTRIIQSTVAKMPCLREEFLDHLVDNQNMVGTLTLLQLAYVAKVQNWRLVPSQSNHLSFEPSLDGLSANIRDKEFSAFAARTSLVNLWDALIEFRPEIDEAKACREWSKYVHELSLDAARKANRAKTPRDLTRSKKDWLGVLRLKEDLL
jgi:hypothetical protein